MSDDALQLHERLSDLSLLFAAKNTKNFRHKPIILLNIMPQAIVHKLKTVGNENEETT